MSNARVDSLHLHERHGEPPRQVAEAAGTVGGGLIGDSHGDRPARAVLVVDRTTHDALGLIPGDLREQITVTGLSAVTTLAPGTEVRIGGAALLQYRETAASPPHLLMIGPGRAGASWPAP